MPAPLFDDHDEQDTRPAKEYLTEYRSSVQDGDEAVAEPLIVQRLENTFARTRNYVPGVLSSGSMFARASLTSTDALDDTKSSVFGLVTANGQSRKSIVDDVLAHAKSTSEPSAPLMSEEERAMQELVDPTEVKTEHTIGRVGGNELFNKQVHHPDMSTLEEYDAIPVESFGLAMLRGMGYEPPKEDRKLNVEERPRRPDFLGIGASVRPEDTKSAQELAVKKHQQRKKDRNYVPLVKINKRTGQIVTEEEDNKQERPAASRQSEDKSIISRPSGFRQKRSRSRSLSQSGRHEPLWRHDKEKSRHHESPRSRSSRYEDDRRDKYHERSRSPRRESDRHRSKAHRSRTER